MAKLDALFRALNQQDGSDLHLVAGQVPIMRIHGDLVRLKSEPSNDQTVRALLREITPPDLWAKYEATGDLDFGYEVEGLARFRCNLFMQKNGSGGVFRLIPSEILTAEATGTAPYLFGSSPGSTRVSSSSPDPPDRANPRPWPPSSTKPTRRETTTS